MRWRKQGIVFRPAGDSDWAVSHAMVPTPTRRDADTIRVYVTCCDRLGIGRPGFVDVSAADPLQIIAVSQKPLLDIGEPGTFDENGVLTCSVVAIDETTTYMYYAGFELGSKIRYRLLSGVAISRDRGATFHRASRAPALERSDAELFFRCGPFCCLENERFRMWYVGGGTWTEVAGKSLPVYDIRYLESLDGLTWAPEGEVQMSICGSDEHGFGRPYVLRKPDGGYRMFYSVRRRSLAAYRLGYAESDDGRQWRRMDETLNLDVSSSGFDDTAIMYAAPIEVDGRLYLFYNGNDFGKDGFALAELEEE